jgi:spore germination cell wall hydrolase CwlJ-like protein
MALGVSNLWTSLWDRSRRLRPYAAALLLVPAASCVPAAAAWAPEQPTLTRAEIAAYVRPEVVAALTDEAAPGFTLLVGGDALAANAAIPVVGGSNPAATSFVFAARTPLDRMRSLDCLAQAVYYEARSESEDGQRAVAQVVLNRVRHPAWPNSVCGVVYQGPMRAGGGCQFTFTCDGSLAHRAFGPSWDRALRIAAEALAGRTFDPVGFSTNYHTSAVFPSWAPRLVKTAVIGAHNFYRLPGIAGAPAAFASAYAGAEPMPRPSAPLRVAQVSASDIPFAPAGGGTGVRVPIASPPPSDIAQDPRWTARDLPEPTVREEYRQSGQWREDAPASVSGR